MVEELENNVILATIEKGLDCLGPTAKTAFWTCMKKDHNIDQTNVLQNLPRFLDITHRFLGVGFNFLDKLFVRYLEQATGQNFEGCKSFRECVDDLSRKRFVTFGSTRKYDL